MADVASKAGPKQSKVTTVAVNTYELLFRNVVYILYTLIKDVLRRSAPKKQGRGEETSGPGRGRPSQRERDLSRSGRHQTL